MSSNGDSECLEARMLVLLLILHNEALGIGLSLLYLRQIGDVIFKFSSVAERRGGRGRASCLHR